jgi:GTPase SAR1 family protein
LLIASNLRTFNHVREWLLEVSKHTHPDTAKLLVGNKSDKVDKFVSTEKGRALANSMNVKFMECSAKLGTNIDDIFQLMTLDLISSR